MKSKRVIAACVIALLVAPTVWLRDAEPAVAGDTVRMIRLNVAQPADWPDALTLVEAWELDGDSPGFSGFSAIIPASDGAGFRAFSDKGRTAMIPRPRANAILQIPVPKVEDDPALGDPPDIEAAVIDAQSGTLWLSYEHHNAVRRFLADGTSASVRPGQMRGWGENSGAEAMARLSDGRFVLLAERKREGLLFASDPVDGARVTRFRFEPSADFLPTAMAPLPDGRVLILLRAVRWQLPPFASMLVIADPAEIRGGEPWPFETLVTFDQPDLRDNYEGMVIEPAGVGPGDGSADSGAVTIWLISDDNRSILQRTLLLRLRWQYRAQTETAREVETSGPLSSD